MSQIPADLLDDDEQRGIRLVALGLLADATDERQRLHAGSDAEALHDFRVAIRRLRSWLRAHHDDLGRDYPRRTERQLRRLGDATSAHRDAEVLTAWLQELQARDDAGPALHAAAEYALAATAASVETAPDFDTDFTRVYETLSEHLPYYHTPHHVHEGQLSSPFSALMAAHIRAHAARVQERLGRIVGSSDERAAHRARIAGKRLRYLVEPIQHHVASGPALIQSLKQLQDVLGDLHDAHVWLARIADMAGDDATASAIAVEVPARPDLTPLVVAAREHEARAFHATTAQRAALFESAGVLALADDVAAELEVRARPAIEVERKYLLHALPELPPHHVVAIDQGYLPGRALVERVRRVRDENGERYYRTVKLGRGVSRTEVEEECSREVFDTLWSLTTGRRVSKRRYVVPSGALTWEIDEFTDRELMLAEVELESAAELPEIPEWLASFVERDVTGEPEYVNANLAR